MPAPLNVDREQVRMLVLAVGCREAARQMGISESTVMQWSARGKWLELVRNPVVPPLPQSMQPVTVSGVSKPVDALQNTLDERHKKTRLGLSKYVRDAAHVAAKSKGDLNLAQAVKAVADIMGKVWPQEAATTNIQVNTLSAKLEL